MFQPLLSKSLLNGAWWTPQPQRMSHRALRASLGFTRMKSPRSQEERGQRSIRPWFYGKPSKFSRRKRPIQWFSLVLPVQRAMIMRKQVSLLPGVCLASLSSLWSQLVKGHHHKHTGWQLFILVLAGHTNLVEEREAWCSYIFAHRKSLRFTVTWQQRLRMPVAFNLYFFLHEGFSSLLPNHCPYHFLWMVINRRKKLCKLTLSESSSSRNFPCQGL